MSLGVTEIVLVLIVVLLLFGGKKIPELARGLGKAQAEYKKAKDAIEHEVNELKTEANKPAKVAKKKPQSAKKASVKKVSAKPAAKKAPIKKAAAQPVAKKSATKKTATKSPAKKAVKTAKK